MKSIIDTYKVIQPSFLSFYSDTALDKEADTFTKVFISPGFLSQIQSVRLKSNRKKLMKLS